MCKSVFALKVSQADLDCIRVWSGIATLAIFASGRTGIKFRDAEQIANFKMLLEMLRLEYTVKVEQEDAD